MSGGGRVEDKSDRVAEINATSDREAREARMAEEARAREAKAAEEAKKREDFERSLESAYGGAIGSARQFFQTQGLDPEQYSSDISQAALSRRSAIPTMDSNPGAYFADLGQSLYNQLETGTRNQYSRQLDEALPQGFAKQRIADTADDDIIAALVAEQQNEAAKYADNLSNRGVINQSALQKAMQSIQDQALRARTNLEQIGLGILEQGRGDLRGIAQDARSQASSARLGQEFDPSQYLSDINTKTTDFFSGLGDRIRGQMPSDLFDTGAILNLAGRTQGAQNTKFDPAAILGLNVGEDDEQQGQGQQKKQASPFGAF